MPSKFAGQYTDLFRAPAEYDARVLELVRRRRYHRNSESVRQRNEEQVPVAPATLERVRAVSDPVGIEYRERMQKAEHAPEARAEAVRLGREALLLELLVPGAARREHAPLAERFGDHEDDERGVDEVSRRRKVEHGEHAARDVDQDAAKCRPGAHADEEQTEEERKDVCPGCMHQK